MAEMNITRDGGFYKKASELFKDPEARKEMEEFGRVMEKIIEKQSKDEKEKSTE